MNKYEEEKVKPFKSQETEFYKGRQIEFGTIISRGKTYYTAKINGFFFSQMFSNQEYAQNKVHWSIDEGNYQ
jgi:hypothetical protein